MNPMVEPRLPATIAVVLVAALAGPARAQDWPMWRHDAARTARQTLPGDIDVPAVRWSLPLGGNLETGQFLVGDANLDGVTEVVLVRGGRLVARHLDGTLIWATEPLGFEWLLALEDFDGNGRSEVFAGGFSRGIAALDGRTGEVTWRIPPGDDMRFTSSAVFPLDLGDGVPTLYVGDAGLSMSGRGTGRVYRFPAGLGGDPAVLAFDTTAHGYWAGINQAAGDLDGDTVVEVVTLSHDGVVAYDPRTGAPVMTTASLGPFPWGNATTSTADVDGDGRDEVVIASNNAGTFATGRRLLLVEWEDGTLAARWSVVFDVAGGMHRFPRRPVADVVAGGPLEIVTSRYDPATPGWAVLVFSGDAATNEPLLVLPDCVLLTLADLDGDTTAEVMVRDADSASLPSLGGVRALRLLPGDPTPTVTEIWSIDHAGLPLAPLPWNAAQSPVLTGSGIDPPRVLLFRDGTRDGRPDAVAAVEVSAGGSIARTLGDDAEAVAVRPGADATSAVILTRSDGSIEALDVGLALQNDEAAPLGVADLLEPNYLASPAAVCRTTAGPLIAAADAGSHAVVFRGDASGGPGPAAPLWRSPLLLAYRHAMTWVSVAERCDRLAMVVRAPDGALQLVLADPADGTATTTAILSPSSFVKPFQAVLPLEGADGMARRVAVPTMDGSDNRVRYAFVDPRDGSVLTPTALTWTPTGGADAPAAAWDRDGDGTRDLHVSQGGPIRAASGADGALLFSRSPVGYGTLAFVDLDGDGGTDVLHEWAGPSRYDTDFNRVWYGGAAARHVGATAPDGAGGIVVASSARHTSVLDLFDGDDGDRRASVALVGGRAWADEDAAIAAGEVPGAIGSVIAADRIAAGVAHSFLVGSTDGRLYVLDAVSASVVWSVDLRAEVGESIAADVDGDGASEIVVAAGDGFLHVIGAADLPAPSAVYDTDGTFIALSPAEDLDEIASSSTLGANWTSVADADGYEYELLGEDDLVVVPWTDVGPERKFVRHDLALQLGSWYRVAVRAYTRGTPPLASAEILSDGFVVVDRDVPEVELAADPDVIHPEGSGTDTSTTLRGRLSDAVGLLRYSLRVETISGAPVRDLGTVEIGGTARDVVEEWDGRDDGGTSRPTGWHRVTLRGEDVAGRSAEASADVLVCGPDAAAEEPLCGGSAGDDDTDGGIDGETDTFDGSGDGIDGEFDETGGGTWSTTGGGCGCRTPHGAPGKTPARWWLATIAAALGLRSLPRRRRPR